SLVIGAVGGVIAVLGADLLEHLRIDDPIGAVPVHGMCGIWGTLSLGLFASGEYSLFGSGRIAPDTSQLMTGLFYGGGTKVLIAQAVGSGITVVATFSVAMTVFLTLN